VRVLGLDVGESRVGVAASDPMGTTAQPLETVKRDEKTLDRLREIAEELEADSFVIGLPVLMDGTEGAQARLVREFALSLEDSVGLPITFVDERLTTRLAESVLAGEPIGHREKKEAADRIAAALILRTYLDGIER
jgi:putative Holliday junction resolvase